MVHPARVNSPGNFPNSVKQDFLFVILDAGMTLDNSAVFQSQVIDYAIALSEAGFEISVLGVYKDYKRYNRLVGQKLRVAGVRSVVRKDRGFLWNLLHLVQAIRLHKKIAPGCIIYMRGIWAGAPIFLSSPFYLHRYWFDVRGDLIDEARARGSAQWRVSILSWIERALLRKAFHVTAVSGGLARIVAERAELDRFPDVIPCCINGEFWDMENKSRTEIRKSLGFTEEDIVFVYSGGLAKYQMIDEMLLLWQLVKDAHKSLKFLMLVNSDPVTLSQQLGNIQEFGNRIQIKRLERGEVAEVLSAADIGFLLREQRALNVSASPIKFAEYIASGLAVVSSPGVGDVSRNIVDNQIGILLRPSMSTPQSAALLEFLNVFEQERESIRKRAMALAQTVYDWDNYTHLFHQIKGRKD